MAGYWLLLDDIAAEEEAFIEALPSLNRAIESYFRTSLSVLQCGWKLILSLTCTS